MPHWTGTTNGYNYDHAIARFHNRDKDNAVGFEMRMTHTEYNALARFIEKLVDDVEAQAREEIAHKVRCALPQEGPRER